jgi:hypothetical protein
MANQVDEKLHEDGIRAEHHEEEPYLKLQSAKIAPSLRAKSPDT